MPVAKSVICRGSGAVGSTASLLKNLLEKDRSSFRRSNKHAGCRTRLHNQVTYRCWGSAKKRGTQGGHTLPADGQADLIWSSHSPTVFGALPDRMPEHPFHDPMLAVTVSGRATAASEFLVRLLNQAFSHDQVRQKTCTLQQWRAPCARPGEVKRCFALKLSRLAMGSR